MNEQELLTVKMMFEHGGDFVKSLAQCFLHADAQNFKKLRKTFIVYWNTYEGVGNKMKKEGKI